MDDQTLRKNALISSMTARLRPLCAGWPEATFDAMVERLADITIKYEGRAMTAGYDDSTTDRLIAEMREMLEKTDSIRRRTSGPEKDPTQGE